MPGTMTGEPQGRREMAFALGIILILCVFFLPIPPLLIDMGLAFSIALSVLILMVALWIEKPLEFSSFPTVLLVATLLRLSLNIATTRLILAHGGEGVTAAGYVIGGFASLVMSGDFVIGLIVFAILITVNFLVITKGATRIAEVGARFTLDAIPGKQMAIDADLSASLIDDKEAQRRRRELEEESAFFGSMDGASKFVRGDAIAGLIILAVNILGGIVLGVTRHKMSLGDAADVFTKLSVGDGLVSQIPALIVSLAAGLLVSKGGVRGSTEKAVIGQLGNYPRALLLAALLMFVLALIPGLPFAPFAALGGTMAFIGTAIPKRFAAERSAAAARKAEEARQAAAEARESVQESLKTAEIELCLGRQLAGKVHLPTTSWRIGSPRCGASSPGSTASWSPISSSPTAWLSRRRATRSASTARPSRPAPCASGRFWWSWAKAAGSTTPAKRFASLPSA
jgi:flagellar biosynthesis protein FlhA